MVFLKLTRFMLKTVLRNTSFWVWSIIFMLFWASMGAYVFSRNITRERLRDSGIPDYLLDEVWNTIVRSYTSGWFASIMALSYAALAGVLVSYLYLSTLPVKYLNKYSRITTRLIIASNITGALLASIVIFVIIYFVMYAMFKHRFHFDFIPSNTMGVIISSIVYAINTYLLSLTLALLAVVSRKPGLVDKLTYAPLTLGVAFVMLSIYVGGGHFYVTPFNSALALIYYYSSSYKPPLDEPLALARGSYVPLEPIHAWMIQVFWLIALALASLYLFEKQRGVSVEELMG